MAENGPGIAGEKEVSPTNRCFPGASWANPRLGARLFAQLLENEFIKAGFCLHVFFRGRI